MIPAVRLAVSSDTEACLRLETECRSAVAGSRGAEAFFAQVPISFRTTDGFTVVAEVDNLIVGFVAARIEREIDEQVATIERLFVTVPARRIGIGDALIAAVRATARDRGCSRLDALALPGDRDTKNLYERNGLTARLIVASTKL